MGARPAKKTPEEIVKENKRLITKSSRYIEREMKRLQREEPKILSEIKKLALKQLHGPAKIRAKDLARLRNQVSQLYILSSQLKGITMQLSSFRCSAAVMEALKRSTQSLKAVGDSMSIKDVMNMVKDYARESETLDVKNDMMENAIDEAMETGDIDADSNKIYEQVCDEVGVDAQNESGPVSMNKLGNEEVKANGVQYKDL